MKSEQEKKQFLSPIERLAELYKSMPRKEGTKGVEVNGKEMELKDSTKVSIYKSKGPGSEISYTVNVYPLGDKQNILEMSIYKSGLDYVEIPNAEIKIGEITTENYHDLSQRWVSNRKRVPAAKVMVDWIDTMTKEDKFIEPPISFSLRI
jgi:hypothetical protein